MKDNISNGGLDFNNNSKKTTSYNNTCDVKREKKIEVRSCDVSSNNKCSINNNGTTSNTLYIKKESDSNLFINLFQKYNISNAYDDKLHLNSLKNSLENISLRTNSLVSMTESINSETFFDCTSLSSEEKRVFLLSAVNSTTFKCVNSEIEEKQEISNKEVGRSISLPPAPRKPPRKYHYTDIRQMITPASVSASTSMGSLRQQQKNPIRIAQPPPPTAKNQQYSVCAPFSSQQYQTCKNHSGEKNFASVNANYTTVFHADPVNGSTTNVAMELKGHAHQMAMHSSNNYQQRHPLLQKHEQQQNASLSFSNIGCSGSTSFPVSSTDTASLIQPSSSALLHFNSVPLLGNKQQSKQQILHYRGNSTVNSTNSLLRQQQKVVPSRSDILKACKKNLFDVACAQQKQIDVNTGELQERRRLISATIAVSTAKPLSSNGPNESSITQQLHSLKAQIARDETELFQLSGIQRDARQFIVNNQQHKQELLLLETAYTQDDAQLRQAMSRVDILKKQLDQLYQRRAFAASAAIAQQRKINAQFEPISNKNQTSTASNSTINASSHIHAPHLQLQTQRFAFNLQQQQPQRPQASVVPFQFDLPNVSINNIDKIFQHHISPTKSTEESSPRSYKSISKSIPIQHCYDESQRFLARGKPDQVSLRADSLSAIKRRSWAQASEDGTNNGSTHVENIWRYLVEEQRKGRTHVSFADIIAAREEAASNTTKQQPNVLNKSVQQSSQSSAIRRGDPPKTRLKPMLDVSPLQNNKTQQEERLNKNHLDDVPQRMLHVKLSNTLRSNFIFTTNAQKKEQKKSEDNVFIKENKVMEKDELEKDEKTPIEDEETKNESGSDDTSNTTTIEPDDENENGMLHHYSQINKKCEEMDPKIQDNQLKEKDYNSDNEEDNTTTVIAKSKTATIPEGSITEEEEENSKLTDIQSEVEEDDDGFMEDVPEFLISGMEEMGSTTTDEASSTNSGGDEPIFDEQSICVSSNVPDGYAVPKGILRAPNVTHHKRHVVFDQTVLFLNVAYEGEYDMLVELASKIPDISVANDEGITALHNAICAENHDIVKFLIENHADVNALDLDGWSPLHCAASCNNLVMLRQLVENGACVFATTLSKAETASDLFEELYANFESGANYIQLVENCMGVVNDAKVYATFSYDAEHDDELSFEEGDELRVIDRFDQLIEDSGSDNESDSNSEVDSYDSSNNGGESCWWLCEHTSMEDSKAGKQGLVPRNYIALYPKWPYREQYGFGSKPNIVLPQELATARTPAQKRRRRRRQLLAEQQQDDHFALLQWSNFSAVAAASHEELTVEKMPQTILQPASKVAGSSCVTVNELENGFNNSFINQNNTKF